MTHAQIEPGQVIGKMEVLERIMDGRYRLKCRLCRYEGVILSGDALNRGRITACWDCTLKQAESVKKAKRVAPRVISAPVPIRQCRDENGWALREAA